MQFFLQGFFSTSHSRGDEDTVGELYTWQLHLKVADPTFQRERKTIFKSPNIIFKILSTPGLFCLPSGLFSSMGKEYLF